MVGSDLKFLQFNYELIAQELTFSKVKVSIEKYIRSLLKLLKFICLFPEILLSLPRPPRLGGLGIINLPK